jgi:hypothetical protein
VNGIHVVVAPQEYEDRFVDVFEGCQLIKHLFEFVVGVSVLLQLGAVINRQGVRIDPDRQDTMRRHASCQDQASRALVIRRPLHVLLLYLVLLGLLFLLGCHVVANRTASRGAKDAVVCHVTGDAADHGARNASLRLGRTRSACYQSQSQGGRQDH